MLRNIFGEPKYNHTITLVYSASLPEEYQPIVFRELSRLFGQTITCQGFSECMIEGQRAYKAVTVINMHVRQIHFTPFRLDRLKKLLTLIQSFTEDYTLSLTIDGVTY